MLAIRDRGAQQIARRKHLQQELPTPVTGLPHWASLVVAAVSGAIALWIVVLSLPAYTGGLLRMHRIESAAMVLGALLALRSGIWPAHLRLTAEHRAPTYTAVLVLLAALWWGWTLGLGALSDDYVLASWARAGDLTPERWPFFRPLPLAVWSAMLWADVPWSWLHALNVVLHGSNAALVGRLARTFFGRRAGWLAGILFLTVPGHTEAVAWTAGVFDVMATTGILVAITAWIHPVHGRRSLLLALFALGAALTTKESAVALPLLLGVLVVSFPRSLLTRSHAAGVVALGGITAVYVVWRTMGGVVGGHLAQVPTSRYQLKELLVRPFAAVLAPVRTDDGTMTLAATSALLCAGVILLALWIRPDRRLERTNGLGHVSSALRLGLLWPVAATLPLLMQFFVSPSLEGSRYAYLSSVGFLIALAGLASAGGGVGRRVRLGLVGGLIAVWLVAGWQERTIWHAAASERDLFLLNAQRAVTEHRCASLDVGNPPDSRRGAYIFREGTPHALADAMTFARDGTPCRARWQDGALVVER
jgi:hypothetical protein